MKKLIHILILMVLGASQGFAQASNIRPEILNQFSAGDRLYFDIYIRTTDETNAFLSHSGFVVMFDKTAFSNPTVGFDNTMTRLATRTGRSIKPSFTSTMLKGGNNDKRINIEYNAPIINSAAQADQLVPMIDSRVNMHCIGRFYITGYLGNVADVGLRFNFVNPNRITFKTTINVVNPDGTPANDGPVIDTTSGVGTFIWLQLGTFSAEPSGRSAELEWTTQNEVRMLSFEIERSMFVDQGFVKIGEVPSKGFPNTLSVYRNVDRDVYNPNDPVPTYYYRIKYIAENGSSSYSPIRAVNFNQFDDIDMNIWPNPTTDVVNMQIRNVVDNFVIVRLLSRNGNLLGEKRFTPNELIRFEVAGVAPGVYFLEVITSKGKRTEKIVVWR